MIVPLLGLALASVPPPPAPQPAGQETSAKQSTPKPRAADFEHKGIVSEFQLGALGCSGPICSTNHNTGPGVQIGGFVGMNLAGFVDVGIRGGWGSLNPRVESGTNALSLYGVDANLLADELEREMDLEQELDLSGLTVSDARSSAANVAVAARVHVIPRGRMSAFVGTGVGYQLYQTKYDTSIGRARLAFHGVAVPIEAGLGVYITRRISLSGQFNYIWTHYSVGTLDHPDQKLRTPLATLTDSSTSVETDFDAELPRFWTATVAFRLTI